MLSTVSDRRLASVVCGLQDAIVMILMNPCGGAVRAGQACNRLQAFCGEAARRWLF